MTDGRTAGSWMVVNSRTPRSPNARPASTSWRSTWRSAPATVVYTGKNAPMAMSVIFDSSPILSHRMSSGTQASDGTARIAPEGRAEERCPTPATSPVRAPRTRPERRADGEADEHPLGRGQDVGAEQPALDELDAGRRRPSRATAAGRSMNTPERGRDLPRDEQRERQDGAADDPPDRRRVEARGGRAVAGASRPPAGRRSRPAARSDRDRVTRSGPGRPS